MARPSRPQRRRAPLLSFTLACAVLAILMTSKGGDARLYPPPLGAPRTTIFLVDNGLHSDLALPRSALLGDPLIGRAAAMTTGDPWVLVGWGDARFYEESGISVARVLDGLSALFAPGRASVVHLEGLTSQPDMAFVSADARPIELSEAGFGRLIARIDRSLARDAGGAPVRLAVATGPDEAFFLSGERFSLIHLCNHWTAEALNAAGLPVSLALDTLPGGLRLDLAVRAKIRAWSSSTPRTSGGSVPGRAPRSGGPPGRAASTG
jgi:uncharacterized protein (TIGR02117 family)